MGFKAYETSSAQKRLHMINHLLGDSILYNETRVLHIEGGLDPGWLKNAVRQLARRHEILRTCFVMKDGQVLQKVYNEIESDFKYTRPQLAGPSLPDIDAIIDDFLKPYQLEKVPLWKIELVQLDKSRQLLLLDFHHIIADGTSMDLIVKELTAFYQGRELPGPQLQYVDYTTWQNDFFRDERIQKQEVYWLKIFAGEIPVLDWPTDFPRSLEADIGGSSVEFEMGDALTARVKELAAQHNITLYVVMLAVFNVLLSKYSNREDIVVGSPISGRTHREFESMVGMFVNTLAMRNKPAAKRTFSDFLSEVSTHALAAFENQDYPFEMLVEKVVPRRQLNRNPLFDVMFALQNYARPIDISQLGNGVGILTPFHFKSRAAKFDLTLQAFEIDRHILFRLEYKTSLFRRDSIERLTGHFINIFHRVTENCRLRIEDIRMISESEREHLLYVLNDPAAAYPADETLHELFEEHVDKTPDKIALVGRAAMGTGKRDIHLTYKKLNEKSNQLARLLRKKGVKADTVVALMLERSLEMIAGILGILKAGGAYLPIDTDYPKKRIMSILEESGALYCLTGENVTRGMSFTSLQNITTKAGRVEPIVTAARRPVKDFDSLPMPDRTLVNYDFYHQNIGIAMARHTVSLQATRGCPYNCAYCHKIWPKKHVVRSAENIFEEMRRIYEAGVKRFVFIDDIFNLDIKNSSKLLAVLIKKMPGIQLFFPNGLRGDILTKEFIDLMVEAGTVNIDLALESASPRIQKMIGKNLHLGKFSENVRYITKKYPRLLLEMELMIGFPTETEEEALMTLNYLKDLQWVHFPNLNILKIYPNTDMCRLALANGVSMESIESSVNLAYHELPDTLPFSRSFTRLFQARFMNEYMLSKERLLHLIPHQVKTLSREELIQKYDSYFPQEIKDFRDILQLGRIPAEEFGAADADVRWLKDESMAVPDFVQRIKKSFPAESREETPEALRILLLDLSQFFTRHSRDMLYDMVEEPLGLMYLATYLNRKFGNRIWGKIAKSRIDFDSFEELKRLIADFRPDVIGIRTLSYYKEFFHSTVAEIRGWGVGAPIIAGGPYASSDYPQMLQDTHVNLAVLGEGESTLADLVEKMMANGHRLPPGNQLRQIPGIAFIGRKDRQLLKQRRREVLLPDQVSEALEREPGENLEKINNQKDLLYIITTSGSTGKPKGVMLEHRNLVNLLNFEFSTTGVAFNNVLQFASIGFDISFQEIFSTLLWGGTLYLINREIRHDIPGLFDFIESRGIRVLFLPPAFLEFVFEEKEYAEAFPKTVKHIIAAGEQLIVPERFRRYLTGNDVYLHNHYGPAETHVVTTLTMTPADWKPQRPSIGGPISNTRIRILDQNLALKPVGVVGEIYITGANVGRGYLNRPELTAEKFLFLPQTSLPQFPTYRTGDLARWLADGNIEFLGRIDNQVKIRGFRIELEEIENHLKKIDFIKEAVVLDCETGSGETYLSAYVVLMYEAREGEKLSELRDILSRGLPGYMVPSYFKKIENIPLSASGKIDRKALRTLETGETGKAYKGRGPGNRIEKELVEIWSGVLKKEKESIGIDENFFELGGHSLNGTVLISKIHKKHHVNVPLAELFKKPTVRGLSEYILNARGSIYEDIKPAPKKEYYPQSSAQKRLFFLDQLQHIGTSYNMPVIYKIGRNLDRKRIEEAFKKLIERHEALKTSLELIDNQPVQKIHDHVELEIEYHDAKRDNIEERIANLIKNFIRPFDLSRAPLLRVGFILFPGGEPLLLFDMHHIITDGTSIEILARDFMTLYEGGELETLRLQYKDFSQWQNSEDVRKLIKQQEEYWLKTFEDEIPLLSIAIDNARPEVRDFEGSHIDFELAPDTIGKLKSMARQQDATLYMVFLAVFNVLLHKLSGQDDLVVGTPIAARRHADLEKIIGMFVNTLAMRNFPGAGRSFNVFLRDVRDRTLEAFENQDYQFEDLVDRLSIARDMSRNPLFDIMFALHNQYEPGRAFRGAAHFENMVPYEYETNIANFDLELHANEIGDRIYFILVYSTRLFKKETAERFVEYFNRIVASVIENPGRKISDIAAGYLPAQRADRQVKQPKKMPLTANGNVGRAARPEPARNAVEEKLMEIWSDVLFGKDGKALHTPIGTGSNFFDLGGHSLKATILISRIHKEFNIKLPMEEFFKEPTVKGIAGFIEKAAKDIFNPIKPVQDREYYALSPAQKRLYVLQQMDVNNTTGTVYNMPLAIPMEEEPEIETVEAAVIKLIKRHESLRTSFHMIKEKPVQRIHQDFNFAVEYEVKAFIRPFDLSRAPLLRVGLLNTGENNYLLMVDMHHIICDGISLQILLRDFRALYNGEALPPLRIRYKDFSEWQNREKDKERVKRQEAYWLRQFEEEIPIPDFPFDYSPPAVRSFEGDTVVFEISPGHTAGLKIIAKEQGATFYMVLLALFNSLLSKLGGREDMVVGTPVAGRRHADLEQVIGMFVNTLALRNYPKGEKSFVEFLNEIKESTLKAFGNQEYQFEDLVDKVGVTRDTGRNPLFDFVFVLQNIDGDSNSHEKTADPDQRQYRYENINRVSKFDLTLTGVEAGGDLFFEIEYCTKLFKKETVERFINYFKNIVSTVVEEPKQKLSKIEIITGEEKKQLVYEFNDTVREYPGDKTIHELFEQQVRRTPDHVVLKKSRIPNKEESISITYKELNKKSNRLAHLLREKGVQTGSIVGIMVARPVEMIIGILGILKAGGAYLPIDPAYPGERIKYMLTDSSAPFLIIDNSSCPSWLLSAPQALIDMSEGHYFKFYPSTLLPFYPSQSSSPAYVIYTSGTTGRPKGVILEHRSVVNTLMCRREEYKMNAGDTSLQLFSFAFDGFVTGFFTPVISGAAVVMLNGQGISGIAEIREAIVKNRVTHFISIPILFQGIIENLTRDETALLKVVTLAGDNLPPHIVETAKEKNEGIEISNEYGVTESSVMSTIYRHQERSGTIQIGRPIWNTQVYILDSYRNPRPIGIPGELCISGAGVARGYLNGPEPTAEKFGRTANGRLYHTGDRARWLPDGNLQFLGRIDHQVKIRGYRVELGEVENRLLENSKIRGAVVSAKTGKDGDSYLCAYIVSGHGAGPPDKKPSGAAELKSYLSRLLPDYMIPSYFMDIEKIPLTANGKIDRKALPAPEVKAGESYAAPGNEIEEKLLEIWSEVLDIGSKGVIGIDDNFFDLGGHSLKIAILSAKIHKELDVRIPLVEIFKTPFIRGLAQYLNEARKDKYISVEVAEEREYYPFSTAQRGIFVQQQREPEMTAYNMPQMVPLPFDIDRDRLEITFKNLIHRHESFRTSFHMIENKPVQRVHDDVKFELEYFDLTAKAKTREDTQRKNKNHHSSFIIHHSFIRPFDLSRAPLLRAGLIKTGENRYGLAMDMHHIITDGVSGEILRKELTALYNREELPPLRLGYKDYAVWRNSRRVKEKIKKQRGFWLKTFEEQIPRLNMPLDFERSVIKRFEGDRASIPIENKLARQLYHLAEQTRTTPYMLLLAVYFVLLSKYTGQEDIVVGSPVTGRRHTDLQELIGMFVNMLAIRNKPAGNKTFKTFLSEVKTNVIHCLENQDYYFQELVTDLGLHGTPGGNPLFDVVFVWENREIDGNAREEQDYTPRTIKARFDLLIHAVEARAGGRIEIDFDYDTALFKRSTIETMAEHFMEILKQVVENDNGRLGDILISQHLTAAGTGIVEGDQKEFAF